MLGQRAVLSNQYRIKSNTESGYGRFDIALIPNQKTNPGFLFELKYAKNAGEDLEALSQIDEKRYDTDLTALGVKTIVKIGIAFSGKNAVVKHAE